MNLTKNVVLAIPARLNSARFPNKLLFEIDGEPLIRKVIKECKSTGYEVVVITDDAPLEDVSQDLCPVFTSKLIHRNGTQRIAEYAETREDITVFINVQGDQLGTNAGDMQNLVDRFSVPKVQIASLYHCDFNQQNFKSPHNIKVVLKKNNEAMYFSRHPIHNEVSNAAFPKFYHHIGIYAYRRNVLLELSKLSQSSIEISESLEQLNWLYHDYDIEMLEAKGEYHSINTRKDVKEV